MMTRILMLDKDVDLLAAMVELLALHNFTVHTATDRKSLRDEFENFKPGIVLMSIKLNNDDGREICKSFRKEHDDIALILMTTSKASLENFKDYGADGVIEKPFDLEEVINTIAQAVKIRKEYIAKKLS